MAFQQAVNKTVPFQDTPLTFPKAYWVVSFEKLDKVSQTAVVVFSAYASKATRETGNIQPLTTHTFTVTGTAFNTYFSPAALTGTNIYAQAYAMAKATTELGKFGTNGKPLGTPTVFFADASDV